nr:alpha-tocopherol transfer protein-like isoform X2 [Cherax quadricarinatus]
MKSSLWAIASCTYLFVVAVEHFIEHCLLMFSKESKKKDNLTWGYPLTLEVMLACGPLAPHSVILPLPGYETSGSRVVITRWGRFEPSKLSLNDLMKASLAVIEVWMDEDEQASVTAMVTVEDCQSLGFSHITALTPSFVKKASALLQEGYPMRPKGLHYINTPAAFDTVFNIFKSFMKEKMRKRSTGLRG